MAKTPKPIRRLRKLESRLKALGCISLGMIHYGNPNRRTLAWTTRDGRRLYQRGKHRYAEPFSRHIPTGLKWPVIRELLAKEPWVYSAQDDNLMRAVGLGEQHNIWPSGKVYAPWTTNQTRMDEMRDAQFTENIEREAEEQGFGIDYSDGGYVSVVEIKDPGDAVVGDRVTIDGMTYTLVDTDESNLYELTMSEYETAIEDDFERSRGRHV